MKIFCSTNDKRMPMDEPLPMEHELNEKFATDGPAFELERNFRRPKTIPCVALGFIISMLRPCAAVTSPRAGWQDFDV